jgi:hypothetical protein
MSVALASFNRASHVEVDEQDRQEQTGRQVVRKKEKDRVALCPCPL